MTPVPLTFQAMSVSISGWRPIFVVMKHMKKSLKVVSAFLVKEKRTASIINRGCTRIELKRLRKISNVAMRKLKSTLINGENSNV